MYNLQCQESELEHHAEVITKAEEKMYFLKQCKHESDSKLHDKFKNSGKVLSETHAIEFGHSQGFLEKDPEYKRVSDAERSNIIKKNVEGKQS